MPETKNKPWSQSERNAEWVRLYRDEKLTFGQIAARTGGARSAIVETVTSYFSRRGISEWRHAPR